LQCNKITFINVSAFVGLLINCKHSNESTGSIKRGAATRLSRRTMRHRVC